MYYKPVSYTRHRKKILWYHALLVGMIPILIYALSINVVTRAPDGYVRDINKAADSQEMLEEAGIYLTPDELGAGISDFMKGRSDRIDTVNKDDELYEYYQVLNNEFTENDYRLLGSLRMFDNILAVLGLISLIWFVIMFSYHVRDSYETKENLRKLFLISLPVQAVFQVVTIVAVAVRPARDLLLNAAGVTFTENDLLPRIFSGRLPVNMAIYILIGTVILTAILAYIIWVTTKPRNTFNERRYFR